jgi:hypothetical protein
MTGVQKVICLLYLFERIDDNDLQKGNQGKRKH